MFVDKRQLNMLAINAVAVVQSLSIDERHLASAVLGADLLDARLDLIGKFSQIGAAQGGRQLVAGEISCTDVWLKLHISAQYRQPRTERQISAAAVGEMRDPAPLGPFQRWQDAQWKRHSVSLR